MRKYGPANFKVRNGTLYAFDREVVVDAKRKKEILEKLENSYGGIRATHSRVIRKYIGVSHQAITDFFNTSERRQLKQPKQSKNIQQTFIAASRVGHLQIDCTFYDNARYVVFGAVDVFSRWCWYKLIKSKESKNTGPALKDCVETIERLSGQKVYKIETDRGGEFGYDPTNVGLPKNKQTIDFKSYCEKRKIYLRSIKAPQRIIENMNGTMRKYIERVDWGTKSELISLIAQFCKEKNESVSNATQRVPDDLVVMSKAESNKLAKEHLAKKREQILNRGKITKKLELGSLVRISLMSDKDALGHAGNKPLWSKTIYRVVKIVGSTRGADRFKLVTDSTNHPKTGMFFRYKLLFIRARPTHSLNQKSKYIPGEAAEGDVKRSEREARPDKVKEVKWVKPIYEDAEDVRASSGDEFVPDVDVIPDEKRSEPAPRKRPKRKTRGVKVKPVKMIGRKVFILYNDAESTSRVVILLKIKNYYVVRFTDGTFMGVHPENIPRLSPDFMTQKTLDKYLKLAPLDIITKEIDAAS